MTTTEGKPVTDTQPGRVRIETHNPDGRKRIGCRVYIDDEDISTRIGAIDFHADAKSLPTATIHVIGAEISAEAPHVTFVRHDPEPATDEAPDTTPPAATTPASIADEIAALRLQIQQLLDGRTCCTPCVAEVTQGHRPAPNIANLINGGVGLCYDHANATTAAVTGRSRGGILVPGQS